MFPIRVRGMEFHSIGLGSGSAVELQSLLNAVVSSLMWNRIVEHSAEWNGTLILIWIAISVAESSIFCDYLLAL